MRPMPKRADVKCQPCSQHSNAPENLATSVMRGPGLYLRSALWDQSLFTIVKRIWLIAQDALVKRQAIPPGGAAGQGCPGASHQIS